MEGGAWHSQHEPAAIDASDLVKTISSPTLIAGELSEEARIVIGRRWKNALIAPPARCLRRAGYLAEIGWERLMSDRVDDPVTLAPIYLSTANSIPA